METRYDEKRLRKGRLQNWFKGGIRMRTNSRDPNDRILTLSATGLALSFVATFGKSQRMQIEQLFRALVKSLVIDCRHLQGRPIARLIENNGELWVRKNNIDVNVHGGPILIRLLARSLRRRLVAAPGSFSQLANWAKVNEEAFEELVLGVLAGQSARLAALTYADGFNRALVNRLKRELAYFINSLTLPEQQAS